jgi:hypothetical protein
MFRRLVPAAVAAAAVVLMPGTASATPAQAPVENIFSAGYNANVQVVLPDGRYVEAWMGQYRGSSADGWYREIALTVHRQQPCGSFTCWTDYAFGLTTVNEDQLHFSRNLADVSLAEVPVTLESWTWDPELGGVSTSEEVAVSVQVSGTGPVDRDSYHSDMCMDGERQCRSMRIDASRAATGAVTVDGGTATGSGLLTYGQGVDASAPKAAQTAGR